LSAAEYSLKVYGGKKESNRHANFTARACLAALGRLFTNGSMRETFVGRGFRRLQGFEPREGSWRFRDFFHPQPWFQTGPVYETGHALGMKKVTRLTKRPTSAIFAQKAGIFCQPCDKEGAMS